MSAWQPIPAQVGSNTTSLICTLLSRWEAACQLHVPAVAADSSAVTDRSTSALVTSGAVESASAVGLSAVSESNGVPSTSPSSQHRDGQHPPPRRRIARRRPRCARNF
eukprot:4875065-Prymnesium_polylepis.1